MNLFLSFVNLCMQEFYEFVCVGSQERKIELDTNREMKNPIQNTVNNGKNSHIRVDNVILPNGKLYF